MPTTAQIAICTQITGDLNLRGKMGDQHIKVAGRELTKQFGSDRDRIGPVMVNPNSSFILKIL